MIGKGGSIGSRVVMGRKLASPKVPFTEGSGPPFSAG